MENQFIKELGMTIRKKRKELKLTQQELAGVSGVGLRFVVELESGKKITLQIGKIEQVLKRLGLRLKIEDKAIHK